MARDGGLIGAHSLQRSNRGATADSCPGQSGPRKVLRRVHKPMAGPARPALDLNEAGIALSQPHTVVLCFASARAARRRTLRLPQPPGLRAHRSTPASHTHDTHLDCCTGGTPSLRGRGRRAPPSPSPSGVGLRVERRSAPAWIDLLLVRNPSLLVWILLSVNSILRCISNCPGRSNQKYSPVSIG